MRPITAADVMNPRVLTVRSDLSVREVARYLVDNEITGAPVEGPDGALVGVVSVVDVADAASEGLSAAAFRARPGYFARPEERPLSPRDLERLAHEELTVEDIMTPEIFTVAEDTPVGEVALRMLRDHLHRLLVVRDDKPVGVVSTSDLLGLLVEGE